MATPAAIGAFEQLVLTAIVSLDANAYGVTIHRCVGELSAPRAVSLGAVYATLERLEDKHLITSWLSEPTAERGGRSRRHYKLQPAGTVALRESIVTARRVCERIDSAWGGTAWNPDPA